MGWRCTLASKNSSTDINDAIHALSHAPVTVFEDDARSMSTEDQHHILHPAFLIWA